MSEGSMNKRDQKNPILEGVFFLLPIVMTFSPKLWWVGLMAILFIIAVINKDSMFLFQEIKQHTKTIGAVIILGIIGISVTSQALLLSCKIMVAYIVYRLMRGIFLRQSFQKCKDQTRAFFLGLVIMIIVVAVKYKFYGNHYKTQQSIRMGWSILSIVIWPFWHGWCQDIPNLKKKIGLTMAGCIAMAMISLNPLVDSDSAAAGFLGGGILYTLLSLPLSPLKAKALLMTVWGGLPLVFLVAMIFMQSRDIVWFNHHVSDHCSYVDRLYIWNDLTQDGQKKPWMGHGIKSTSRHEQTYGKKPPRIFSFKDQRLYPSSPGLVHAHNYMVELFYETGLVGLIIFYIFMYIAIAHMLSYSKKNVWPMVAAIGTSTQMIVGLNASLWHSWVIMAFVVAMAAAHWIQQNSPTLNEK
jgi:hypothetical protein